MTIEDVRKLVRPHLLSLQPYSSARDEFDQAAASQSYIFLDANENPEQTGLNRYPDPHQRQLKKNLSAIKGVKEESLFIGNGSDEPIDLIIRLFCQPGKHNILIPVPTYGMYKVSAEINEVAIKSMLLTEDFQLPDNFLTAADENTRIVFLCTPNNPSGNLLDRASVEGVLKNFRGIVVVDEAYIDFAGSASWLSLLDQYPNLIVLQTLSKAWGLAGLRIGMAFCHKEIVGLLDKIKPPYNISIVAQNQAIVSTRSAEATAQAAATICAERDRVAKELSSFTAVKKIYPSEANFLLVKINQAGEVYHRLIDAGIVVRDRSTVKRCEDCLRITIGTKKENDRLIDVLKSLK